MGELIVCCSCVVPHIYPFLSHTTPSQGADQHKIATSPTTGACIITLRQKITSISSPPSLFFHPRASTPPRMDREIPRVTAPTGRKRSILSNYWPGGFWIVRLRAAGFAFCLVLQSELLVRHVLEDEIGTASIAQKRIGHHVRNEVTTPMC